MRTASLQESRESELELSADQATALRDAGKRLRSDAAWWGDSPEAEVHDRTVIAVSPRGDGKYAVTVRDAIGLISVGDLQIEVRPKIPLNHVVFLLARSGTLPRLDSGRVGAAKNTSLWQLVARWFVEHAERVVRRDLIRDYCEVQRSEPVVKGRLNPLLTARNVYSGRLEFPCTYDEFSIDTPLNRVLRAATLAVGSSTRLDPQLRHRARSLLARMDGIGELRPNDTRARPTRVESHYIDALTLARHVLRSIDRSPALGGELAWTFLIRTPTAIEEGLRQVLAEGLAPNHSVTKRSLPIEGANLTFNPDLYFDAGLAVGDVKYKVASGEWRRSDLYQGISFAVAAGSSHGCVVDFARAPQVCPPQIKIGDIRMAQFSWQALDELDPWDSAASLVSEVADWLAVHNPTAPAVLHAG